MKKFGPRGVLKCKATDKDDATVDPRFGKIGKQTIEDTGPLTKKRMETIDDETSAAAIDYMKRQHSTGKPFFVDAMILNVRSFGFGIDLEANAYLPRRGMWPGAESNCRHEISSPHTHRDYVCHYRSLLVSIQAFNAGALTFILPIRT